MTRYYVYNKEAERRVSTKTYTYLEANTIAQRLNNKNSLNPRARGGRPYDPISVDVFNGLRNYKKFGVFGA